MTSAEELLGWNYRDLGSSRILAGIIIPPPETIVDKKYVTVHQRGIGFILNDTLTVVTIQLHRAGHEHFMGFEGELPGRLDWSMRRSDVQKSLGIPIQSGEEVTLPFLGRKPPWDLFVRGSLATHVEYMPDNKPGIQMISLSKAAPSDDSG